jgi:hypothetical protein
MAHQRRHWPTTLVLRKASDSSLSLSALLVSDSTIKEPAALVRAHGRLLLTLKKLIAFVSVADYTYVCDHLFENGGWLQVRFKSFAGAPSWHIARDGLRGIDVYGYPGASEYSIYYKHLLQGDTEMLFRAGPGVIVSLYSYLGNLSSDLSIFQIRVNRIMQGAMGTLTLCFLKK